MPTAEIYVHEGRYDEQRLAALGEAIQSALEAVLEVPLKTITASRIFCRGAVTPRLSAPQHDHTKNELTLTLVRDLVLARLPFADVVFDTQYSASGVTQCLPASHDRPVQQVALVQSLFAETHAGAGVTQ